MAWPESFDETGGGNKDVARKTSEGREPGTAEPNGRNRSRFVVLALLIGLGLAPVLYLNERGSIDQGVAVTASPGAVAPGVTKTAKEESDFAPRVEEAPYSRRAWILNRNTHKRTLMAVNIVHSGMFLGKSEEQLSRAIPLSGEDAGRCEDPSGLITYSIDTEGPSSTNYLLVEIKRGKVSKVSIPDMPQVDVQMSESSGGARDGSDKIEEGRLIAGSGRYKQRTNSRRF